MYASFKQLRAFNRTVTKERVKADIGIMNSGGVRASIEEGKVTYKLY
ncbi:bifunctional UDP-sugar hydrolase/5'-nucleotidase periplasmic [Actinobacillus equuli]|nr:bifunctional UDP-sugar hydrolase/5'-nucleotidase periplasmic [Actinobacillus equuli]